MATVTNGTNERLYHLLPAIHRVRDVERGEPLRALLAVIEREMDRLEQDIDGLYDDWFIETCAEWVAPYIGDLLSVRNLHAVDSAGIFSSRAYVQNARDLGNRIEFTEVADAQHFDAFVAFPSMSRYQPLLPHVHRALDAALEKVMKKR